MYGAKARTLQLKPVPFKLIHYLIVAGFDSASVFRGGVLLEA